MDTLQIGEKMSKPICKIADIIFVRFELVDLAPQKEYTPQLDL